MKRNCILISLISAATIWIAVMGTGCAHCGFIEEEEEGNFSLKGSAGEFSRGAVNVALCWLEIPHKVEAKIRKVEPKGPFGILSSGFAIIGGTIKGSLWGVKRLAGGSVEIAFSPFPPYEPMMHPGYPPYLNPGKDKKDTACKNIYPSGDSDFLSTQTTHKETDYSDIHYEKKDTCFETIIKDMPFDETGTLELTNVNGSITINGWEQKGIQMKVEKRITPTKPWLFFGRSGGHIHDKGMAKEYLDAVKIEISGDEYYTCIKTHDPCINKRGIQFHVNYEVFVPKEAELKIRGCNGKITAMPPFGNVPGMHMSSRFFLVPRV
jgi:putative exosortase-associated protein (TIGR04073 family)